MHLRTASDGIVRTTRTLQLIVLQQNDAPQITPIADQTIIANTSTEALPFTLSDVDHPLTAINLIAASSNTARVPTDAIVLGGTAAVRTITVTLANPHAAPAPVEIAFLRPDGTSVTQTRTLAPTSRSTLRVDESRASKAPRSRPSSLPPRTSRSSSKGQ